MSVPSFVPAVLYASRYLEERTFWVGFEFLDVKNAVSKRAGSPVPLAHESYRREGIPSSARCDEVRIVNSRLVNGDSESGGSGGAGCARLEQMRVVRADDLVDAPCEQAQIQLLQVASTAVEVDCRKERFDHVGAHVPCGLMERVWIEVQQLMELMLVADLGEAIVPEQKPLEPREMVGPNPRKHRDQHSHLHALEGAVAETLQRLVAAGGTV